MAYTVLPTQSAGQTASAAGWANLVKANFEAMGPHLIARKTSNENVTTTTLQSDDHLLFAVAANEVWQIELHLLVTLGAGGMKLSWSFPASGTMRGSLYGTDAAGTDHEHQNVNLTVSDGSTVTTTVNSSGRHYLFKGVYANAGTSGTVTLRNALNTASGTSTIETNSTLWGAKLA